MFETDKRINTLSQLFCLPAHVCCSAWERKISVFLTSTLWDLYISVGKLPKSWGFPEITEPSPFLGSKTPFWSLWLTVGTALQKQLWGGFRVILRGEILTTDWIFKAESLRSCPAEWLLPFSLLSFPLPLFLQSWAFISCVRAVVQIHDGDLLHKLNVSESLAFVPGMLLSFFFFSCSKMIFSKSQILILLSYGWFCWWRTTEFLHHLYVCSWTTVIGVSSSVCPFI